MDPTIAVSFDGHHRIELVQGEDRTIEMAFRDSNTDTPINLAAATLTVRLPSEDGAPILRSSGAIGGGIVQALQINLGSDVFLVANHGLVTGDPVQASSTGTLPAPLASSTTYYVSVLDQSTFQLTDSGGNIINLTSLGSGMLALVCADILIDQAAQGLATLSLRAEVTAQLQPEEGQSFLVGLNIGGKQRYVIVSNELDVAEAPE